MKTVAGFLLLSLTAAAQVRVAPIRSRSPAPQVTFNNHIVRILQQNCQTCHRPGSIAPFPLLVD